MKTIDVFTSIGAAWLCSLQIGCAPAGNSALVSPSDGTVQRVNNHSEQDMNWDDELPTLTLGLTLAEMSALIEEAADRRLAAHRKDPSGSISRSRYYPPKHQFTVLRDDSTATCMIAKVHPMVEYYSFLFVDGRLCKIVGSFPVEWEIVLGKDGRRVGVPRIRNQQEQLRHVFESEGMSIDQFVASARKRIVASHRSLRKTEFNLALILSTIGNPSTKGHYRRHIELMKKYDATKIQLGMSRDQVDNIFGPTKDVETVGDAAVVRRYGEAAAIGWFEIPWVSVEFHEGEVVSVITTYTSEFGKPVSRPSQGR